MTDILAQSASSSGLYDGPLQITATTVLPGIVFTTLMLLPRAWPRFVLLRLTLATKGQLPWGFVQFLDDARKRQLLRQSGGLYQFRHIRLQERLASRSLAQNRVSTSRPRTARRRRLQVAVIATALAASTVFINQTLMPEDTSHIVLPAEDNVEGIAFGPPGKHSLVTVDQDGTVQRWDTETGAGVTAGQVNSRKDTTLWYPVGSHKDGAVLVAYDKFRIIRKVADLPWDGPPRMRYRKLPDGASSWYLLGVSTGGRLLLENNSGARVLRDTGGAGGKESPFTVKADLWGADVAIADNGTALISQEGKRRIEVHELGRHRIRCRLPDSDGRMAIDARGTRFATARGTTVSLWDAQCDKEGQSITTYDGVERLALNADGTELAVSIDGGDTRLYTLPAPGE